MRRSTNPKERQEALWALYQIKEGWTQKMSSGSEQKGQLLAPSSLLSVQDLDDIEYHLAYHYVSSFAAIIGRAPLLPHRLL